MKISFYDQVVDWREESYKTNFSKYIDYLVESIEILCKNYGKIGGFWFDAMWDKKTQIGKRIDCTEPFVNISLMR